jgi:hypothetical protein
MRDDCLRRMKLPSSELVFESIIQIPHCEGFVAIRPNGRLQLIESDTYEAELAAGNLPPGCSYQ